jgi:hypothetical protein
VVLDIIIKEKMAETKKKSSSSNSSSSTETSSDYLVNLVWVGAVAYALFLFLNNAYIIRLQAIEEFGPVIHEFDPYFNWRATQVCHLFIMCWIFLINVSKFI